LCNIYSIRIDAVDLNMAYQDFCSVRKSSVNLFLLETERIEKQRNRGKAEYIEYISLKSILH
jgi:hypothetical protein